MFRAHVAPAYGVQLAWISCRYLPPRPVRFAAAGSARAARRHVVAVKA
jgi:hypothetical protein